MPEGRDERGKFKKGWAGGPGRRKGTTKDKTQKVGKRFLEDMVIRRYKTALGANQALDELLEKMDEKDRAAIEVRLLEMYGRIQPKDVRVDTGVTVNFVMEGIRPPAPCEVCGHVPYRKQSGREIEGEVVQPPALPPPETEDPRMPHPRSESCPEIEERRHQRTPEEERELDLINARLKNDDDALRRQNAERSEMGLPPLSEIDPFPFGGSGVEGA